MARNNTKLPINIFQALSQKRYFKVPGGGGGEYPRNFRVAGGAPLGRALRVFSLTKEKIAKVITLGRVDGLLVHYYLRIRNNVCQFCPN